VRSFTNPGETLIAFSGLNNSASLSNEPSFEQIVRDHQAMVFRTLMRLTGRRDGVDDLAQDVFLRLFRALPGFRNEALVSTYLYRIAVNVAQDEWKRRRREDRTHVSLSDETAAWEDRLEHPGQNPEESLEERQFQRLVEEHLMELSVIERSVLVLYHQEERSYQQIAEALGMPIGTVRTHLHRGRKKMRDAIDRQEVKR
jgi:RNA polymerase sigma factor (sigma-70 family)